MTGIVVFSVDFGIFGEAHEATCNLETESRLNENGARLIDAIEKTSGDANCPTTSTECNQPWAASGEEDGTTGVVQSNAGLCLDPAEGPICQGNAAYTMTEMEDETYTSDYDHVSVGVCELDIDLHTESTVSSNAALHINHP